MVADTTNANNSPDIISYTLVIATSVKQVRNKGMSVTAEEEAFDLSTASYCQWNT